LVAKDGGIFTFGDAGYHGSAVGQAPAGSVVSIVATGDGGGYWVIGDDGNIYSFGDAPNANLTPKYLGEMNPVDTYGYFYTADTSHEVNGHIYTQSVYGLTEGDWVQPIEINYAYAEWNLARNYSYLNTTIGLDDSSKPSGVVVRAQIFGDGVQLYSQDLALGQAFPIHLKIAGVLRLKLETTEISDPGEVYAGAEAVFGSAEVTP
jgi:hypothetical protein